MTKTSNSAFDTIVVGQGLAGSALALTLMERGQRVCVIDGDTPGSASRVAAGLITPVTGAKLKAQPHFNDLISVATEHYRRIEQLTESDLLTQRTALRLLSKPRELRAWDDRDAALTEQMIPYHDSMPAGIIPSTVIAQMPAAARLSVSHYVTVVREYLTKNAAFVAGRIEPEDLLVHEDRVSLPSFELEANRVVFCRGFADRDNAFFAPLTWRPAKGQILRISSSFLKATGTVHGNGLWITPDRDGHFLVGATYEWDDLDDSITPSARVDIETRLAECLDADYEVLAQTAGVRPIVSGRMPVAGASEQTPRVLLMNGLGSKGALFAPALAQTMAAHIVDATDIDSRFDLALRLAETP